MKHLLFSAMLISLSLHANIQPTQKAVINVPIADLIGNTIVSVRPDEQTEAAYNNITLCGVQTNSAFACPRIHQLLYNDIVEIIKTNNDEVCISTPHAFYLTASSPTPQTHYWMLKKNITPLDDI